MLVDLVGGTLLCMHMFIRRLYRTASGFVTKPTYVHVRIGHSSIIGLG